MLNMKRSHTHLCSRWLIALLCWTTALSSAASAQASDRSSASEVFKKATFSDEQGDRLHYRIHLPSQASEDNKLPLVLFLHGAGERGDDNEAQLKHGVGEFLTAQRAQNFPAILIAPQCPKGHQWVETDWSATDGKGSFPADPSPTMKLVFGLLDELVRGGNVDTSRMYVTGLSMGGYASWYAAAKYDVPNLAAPSKPDSSERRSGGFAAMLAICGGGDSTWTQCYDSVSVWAVHGDADSVVPVVRSRAMIAALVQAGHPGEIRYTEYPGVGHDSWTQTYANNATYEWLFSQMRR